jgi:signal transduction histidine kinase
MNSLVNSSASIRQTLRYVEWILIALYFLTNLFDLIFDGSIESAWRSSIFLGGFALMSSIFPIDRVFWQRQVYLFLGIIWAISAMSTGVVLDVFLYLYIAKSCFLLNRKNLVLIVAIAGVASVTIFILALPTIVQTNPIWNINLSNSQQIGRVAFDRAISYIMASAFTISFSFLIIAEKKSRQKAEALTQQIESLASTLERTRIARDIHDSLGHTLTSLNIQLAAAQKLYRRRPHEALQALNIAKFLAEHSIEDVNRTLQTMRQSNFNLNQALVALLEQIKCDRSLKIQWKIDLPQLPLPNSHHIYYIVKEGLINIQKHARASCIRFCCLSNDNEIELEIEDNGQGFDPKKSLSGLGLQGIQERVQLLGGKLTIASMLGQGTRIQIVFPR